MDKMKCKRFYYCLPLLILVLLTASSLKGAQAAPIANFDNLNYQTELLNTIPGSVAAAAFTSCSEVDVPQAECEALLDLYNSTAGASWYDNTGWLISDQVCTWYGIVCSEGRVSEIRLNYNNLKGQLNTDFSGFSNLSWFNLSANQLNGDFASIIEKLPAGLGGLWLGYNQISGTIPSSIVTFTNLSFLGVESNNLTGDMSIIIDNLPTGLETLILANNQFSGTIPSSISNFSSLWSLEMSGNALTGDMASIISNLPTGLGYLRLWGNQFSGTIPSDISNFTDLLELNLGSNQLTGDMSIIIDNLPAGLKTLWLHENQFTGTIPPTISRLSSLSVLGLGENQVDGDISMILSNLPSGLVTLKLGNAQLTGDISSSLSGLTDLRYFDVENNLLTGDMTDIISSLPAGITYLYLRGNQFVGSIPSMISNLTNLREIDISDNVSVVGIIPMEITNLSLYNFKFSGTYLCEPNDQDYTSWKEGITTYSIGLCAPVEPVAPSNTIIESSPAFEWRGGGDAGQFQLVVNDTNGEIFTNLYDTSAICSAEICSVTPDLALSPGDYQWTVRGIYQTEEGDWASSTNFTVIAASTWYLAEGFTAGGFGTFILIQNPNDTDAHVYLTYMLQDGGGTIVTDVVVPANSRFTVVAQHEDQVGPNQAFSTRLDADRPIIVERAMYWPNGGHVTIGVTSPQNTWYLAEGYTAEGFVTFILIQNPTEIDAHVTLTYMLQDGGGTIVKEVVVSANSRCTVLTHDTEQVGLGKAFSTRLVSDQPIIVERAMYFNTGGHNTNGVTNIN